MGRPKKRPRPDDSFSTEDATYVDQVAALFDPNLSTLDFSGSFPGPNLFAAPNDDGVTQDQLDLTYPSYSNDAFDSFPSLQPVTEPLQ